MPEARARKGPPRSRKGCPECRKRKIKCDETRPECNQCVKSGRSCQIIDGLFRAHSLSTPAKAETVSQLKGSPRPASASHDNAPSLMNIKPSAGEADPSTPVAAHENAELTSPVNPRGSFQGSIPIGGLLSQSSPGRTFSEIVNTPSVRSLPSEGAPTSTPSVAYSKPTVAGHAYSKTSSLPTGIIEERGQDCVEVNFFLRHFAEISGQWMDICTGQRSYFSQYIVQLASQSPLLRYSACAMAAKQMGQMKDSTPATEVTRRSSISASNLLRPAADMDFEWYGAKYYEKAILLMARQISHDRLTVQNHLSPGEIYLSPGSDLFNHDDHESTSSAYRILAACILCSYEDLNATMRAWTGHLDGISKLLRPHLDLPVSPDNFYRIPQSLRALDVAFWYFALNDMLNSLTLHQPCRIDPDDICLWQKMGLPLDTCGRLALGQVEESHHETTCFKALVRLLCKLLIRDINDSVQWNDLSVDLTLWYNSLPAEFLSPITQPLPTNTHENQEPPEIWFGSDICAIAMAFYHMARILVLINKPAESNTALSERPRDLLSAYNALQRDLSHHTTHIFAIAHGMASVTVQKYMLQPLYIAGRCVSSHHVRQDVLGLLRRIEKCLGLATEYRVKDLIDEWGSSYEEFSNC